MWPVCVCSAANLGGSEDLRCTPQLLTVRTDTYSSERADSCDSLCILQYITKDYSPSAQSKLLEHDKVSGLHVCTPGLGQIVSAVRM